MTVHSGLNRILQAIVAALLLSASVWAADAAPSVSKGSLELLSPANVAGTQLQSGKYRVEWTGAGDQVQVKIYSGKREVASTHARLVKDGTSYDHLSYTTGENGTKSLAQMSFAKEKCSLLLENESASSRTERAGK